MSKENELLTEIDEVLKNDVSQRHSYFQMKYFIIGKEPTLQAKMWQCLRELKSRRESLSAIELEFEDLKDKLELLDISIKRFEMAENLSDIDKDEIKIKIRQINRQKNAIRTNLLQLVDRQKWIKEESRFFLDTFQNFVKIEPLKHFDDIDAQKHYWSERLTQNLNLKMLSSNQLDTELIETIIALPDDMLIKKQTLGTLHLRHANMVRQLKETVKDNEKLEEN